MAGGISEKRKAMGGERITISDVADALSIAKGTVSRALNDHPDISDDTKRRVREAAESMGYRPMGLAQAIKTGRSRALGLVLQEDEIGGPGPFLAEFLSGISAAASAEHWTLTVAFANTVEGVRETQERLVGERKADGFILPRSRISDERLEYLKSAGVPFVLFGRVEDPTGCAWFDIQGEDAIQQAVERLAGMGHQRIALINGGTEYYYATLRAGGYCNGLNTSGHAFDPALVREDAITTEQGHAAALDLLRQANPPTAIVASVDRAGLGVYRAAAELGLTIGKDISVISYDGVPEGEYANPPLTTFSVDLRTAGERLATLLIARVRGEAPEGLRELAAAELVVRASDGPPSMSSDELALRIAAQKD